MWSKLRRFGVGASRARSVAATIRVDVGLERVERRRRRGGRGDELAGEQG
jgi:hypothetical protein